MLHFSSQWWMWSGASCPNPNNRLIVKSWDKATALPGISQYWSPNWNEPRKWHPPQLIHLFIVRDLEKWEATGKPQIYVKTKETTWHWFGGSVDQGRGRRRLCDPDMIMEIKAGFSDLFLPPRFHGGILHDYWHLSPISRKLPFAIISLPTHRRLCVRVMGKHIPCSGAFVWGVIKGGHRTFRPSSNYELLLELLNGMRGLE